LTAKLIEGTVSLPYCELQSALPWTYLVGWKCSVFFAIYFKQRRFPGPAPEPARETTTWQTENNIKSRLKAR